MIAWHTLSNAFYLVRGHSKSTATALQFINDLLDWADVAQTSKICIVVRAIRHQ